VKEYSTSQIRNVALASHGGAGKTSLTEAILFSAGESNRLGSVDEGTTVSDYNPDEVERKISISTGVVHCFWNDCKLNILDTPGYADFIGEVKAALRVADSVVILISAVTGVEVNTQTVWKFATEYGLPRCFYVNRLDREHADFDKALRMARERFGDRVLPLQLPVNPGVDFDSILELLPLKLIKFAKDKTGQYTETAVPAELKPRAEEWREKLMEAAAESDDELLEKFLDKGSLTEEEFRRGVRAGILSKKIFPVLCGAATANIGTRPLMDFLTQFAPSPIDRGAVEATKPTGNEKVTREPKPEAPVAALVFKTVSEPHVGELSFFRVYSGTMKSGMELFNPNRNVVEKIGTIYLMNGKNRKEVGQLPPGDIGAVVKLRDTHTGNTLCDRREPAILKGVELPEPVIRVAIEPKSKGDEEKISAGLAALHEEDPTFVAQYDPELGQTIISGQGELHLDIVVKRLKDKFGVDVNLVEPKIPYRETIKATAEAQGKYKRQTGGRGQYGDVWLRIEPLPRGGGFEFVDAIVGGVVPGKYIPAVEKGIREAMAEGVIAGYPATDFRITLFDGTYHPVDSSDLAFKIAGSLGFKNAFKEAKPTLLEPIYDLEVIVPEEYLGDVMGDLSSRRGKILGIQAEGHLQVIKAKVALAELHRYSTSLRSMTQGQGIYRMKFSHYEELPREITDKLVAEYEARKEKGELKRT